MTELVLSATAVLCAVLLLRGIFAKRMSMRLRYALWALVLVRLLLPTTLPSPMSVLNLVPQPAIVANIPMEAVQPVVPENAGLAKNETTPAGAIPAVTVTEPEVAPPVVVPAVRHETRGLTTEQVLGILWLAGACVAGAWLLLSNLRFYRSVRKATPCPQVAGPLPVYRADFLPSPCLVGLLQPRVYVTGDVLARPDSLRHVLTHEYCHWRHGDNWWALLRGLCLALWWFHPLVWVAAVLSRKDCELACDESAMRRLGESQRISYGETLVHLVARRPVPADLIRASTAMTAGKREIRERVRQVASGKRMTRAALALVLILAIGAGACTLTGAAERSPESKVGEFITDINLNYTVPAPDDNYRPGGEDIYRISDLYYDWQEGVPKRELGYTVKDLTPEAIGLTYDPEEEDGRLMRNLSYNWAEAFAQQFYYLPEEHPLASDKVVASNVSSFYSKTTVSGLTKTVNSHEGYLSIAVHPVGGLEQAEAYLKGKNIDYSAYEDTGNLYLFCRVTLSRSTRTNGQTLWTCTKFEFDPYGHAYTTDGTTEGNYSPMTLPVTVKPREGWQVSAIDVETFCVPDDPELDYYGCGADQDELHRRWGYAYGQMYYALPEDNPYHAAEVILLPGQGDADFTLAVKPSKGIEAVRSFFPGGGCPEGTGELKGYALLRYQVGLMRETVSMFGDEPVWMWRGSAALWSTTPCPDSAEWTQENMAQWTSRLWCKSAVLAEDKGTDTWGEQGAQWAEQYTQRLLDGNYRYAPNHAYQTQVLDMKLTGASQNDEPRVLEYSLRFAYLPTWGVEKALEWHRRDGERYLPEYPELADGENYDDYNYRPELAWAGTGDLQGWVVVEIPGLYLSYETNRLEQSYLVTIGMAGYGYQPPAGSTWIKT